ncbi:uncharacterized protein TRUGW13939_11161 [Talaromyces rugulosus]|uniref:AB hydrolase-1 domain-containing protein n=1 Tax=Talaromyces rugulosus TaxID=121627 RepID=A0A7H8RDC2_TALRU|nr:uncharacterized protein TRUGW13939_11161 [Talaromyces rugulosus]QKX63988.1 hypothetical protein TRUGW13939_11161 [Talaromyces rugulosus]
MPYVKSKYDGAMLSYRNYVPQLSPLGFRIDDTTTSQTKPNNHKPALVFSAGWPFSSHMYNVIATPLCESYRYQCILPDRRGFGKSEWSGPDSATKSSIDYSVFADDLGHIVDSAEFASGQGGFVGIGTSLGCGEIVQMIINDSTGALGRRCKGLVFLCSSLPIPMQTESKPWGPPRAYWDDLLSRIRQNSGEALQSCMDVIFGASAFQNTMTHHERARFERMAIAEADPMAVERTVQIFLDRDLTDSLREFGEKWCDIPVLMLHGSEDLANPVDRSPAYVMNLLPNSDSELKVYEGSAHDR